MNNDGKVEIADVVSAAAFVGDQQSNPLSDEALILGDVQNHGDGITSGDVLMIQQYLANIISSLDPDA